MIFQTQDELKEGATISVSRSEEWAYLPAIRWESDPHVPNVLPQADLDSRGYFTTEDGLRQILRDQYNTDPETLDHYIIRNTTHYAVAKVLRVTVLFAMFEVLYVAPKTLVENLRSLVNVGTIDEKALIRTASQFPFSTLAFWNYRISFTTTEPDWQILRELVEKLPHGAGWNNTWHIHVSQNDFEIYMNYEIDSGFGTESVDVGWRLRHEVNKWVVGEQLEETPEVPESYFDADEWGLPEMERLFDDLATELQEALNG